MQIPTTALPAAPTNNVWADRRIFRSMQWVPTEICSRAQLAWPEAANRMTICCLIQYQLYHFLFGSSLAGLDQQKFEEKYVRTIHK